MTARIKIQCDITMCKSDKYIQVDDLECWNNDVLNDWYCDAVNDIHYCPSCTMDMTESGELEG